MKKAIILGGGFAGVEAAISLQKSGMFDVTLISDRDYLFIYPISIWIPVNGITIEDVKLPLASIQKAHPFTVVIDKVVAIYAADNKVECVKQQFDYDYLILALGADKVGQTGIENTLSICGKPTVSMLVKESLDLLISNGKGKIAIGFGGNPKDKSAVRGGPAFEFAFNVHHYLKNLKIRDNFDISFFAPMESPGARMGDKAPAMIGKMLNKARISQHYGKKIKEFQTNNITFEDDTKIEADLIMFIAASKGNSIFTNSDLPLNDAGFIKIDDNCKVENFANVFAIGDAAAIDGYDWVAKQGHIAELMGRNAAYNIIQTEKGSNKREGYHSHLNILCIMDTGNGAAFVLRDPKRAILIPLPIVGHWIKKAWGWYVKASKTGRFPRIL